MMSVLRHAFDWGYGYVLLALIGGMILCDLNFGWGWVFLLRSFFGFKMS